MTQTTYTVDMGNITLRTQNARTAELESRNGHTVTAVNHE